MRWVLDRFDGEAVAKCIYMKTETGISNETGFAKSVLWHLASIQADVYQNQMLLIELLARQLDQSAEKI